jgi:OOP family OmpA-OmpF porin
MSTFSRISISICAAGLLAGCASTQPYSPSPYDAAELDPSAFVPKVDSFIVVVDASASMGHRYQGRSRYNDAMDVVYRMNETIPPLGYRSGLAAYSSGTCLDGASVQMLYGMAPYNSADFASAQQGISCAGGTTPLAGAIDVATDNLDGTSGDTALIIVSDFDQVDSGDVASALGRMQTTSGDRLCVHTITIGDDSWAHEVAEDITAVSECGSAMNAADVASPDSMANYVTAVLLAPAPPAAAPAVHYEKNTMSTAALFDFDSDVLREEGKVALHELGDAIKAKGAKVVDIDIIGHTDSTGPADYNQGLSERRAQAVADYIISEGIDATIIDVSGEGENNPIASNDTAEGRAQNRRVDINVGVEQATN